MDTNIKLVLLGFGTVSSAIAQAAVAAGWSVSATTRDRGKEQEIRAAGVEPIVVHSLDGTQVSELVKDAYVLVSFPPGRDGNTDSYIAPFCTGARSIIYISSTSVYDESAVEIDDFTALGQNVNAAGKVRQKAEAAWRAQQATVLRLCSFYGESVGLHLDLRYGTVPIPGDGAGFISFISLSDLSCVVLACFKQGLKNDAFVVADALPVTKLEVIKWLCEQQNIPVPQSVPLEELHFSLRPSRKVDGSRLLKCLSLDLKYPTYRDGFGHSLNQIAN